MLHLTMMFLVLVAFALPPAAKTLTVAATVYAVLQAAKQSPWAAKYISGWVAVLANVILTVLGVVLAPPGIPADQLYTLATFQQIVITVFLSAGLHGTVSKVLLPSLKGQNASQAAKVATKGK